ncbi:hypothetical protein AALC17_11645 [Oscillospiraceae bacterium 38-13]
MNGLLPQTLLAKMHSMAGGFHEKAEVVPCFFHGKALAKDTDTEVSRKEPRERKKNSIY